MKQKTTMRMVVATVSLVLVFILSACGGNAGGGGGTSGGNTSGGGGSPADAAKAFFDALFSGGAIDQYVCKSNAAAVDGLKQGVNTMKTSLAATGAKIDISGLKFEASNVSGDSADVKVSGKLKTTANGNSMDTDYPPATLKMKNESGWKVCG